MASGQLASGQLASGQLAALCEGCAVGVGDSGPKVPKDGCEQWCSICAGVRGGLGELAAAGAAAALSADGGFEFDVCEVRPTFSLVFELRERVWKVLSDKQADSNKVALAARVAGTATPIVDGLREELKSAVQAAVSAGRGSNGGSSSAESSGKGTVVVEVHVGAGAAAEAAARALLMDVLGVAAQARRRKRQRGGSGDGGAAGSNLSAAEFMSSVVSRGQIDQVVGALQERGARRVSMQALEQPFSVSARCLREPLFVTGRYVKLARGLTQSPWSIGGQRRGSSSVAELLCLGLAERFGPSEHKFHSAGREDMDVRMLGDGRPFVVELINARRMPTADALAAVQSEVINADEQGRVLCHGLALGDGRAMDALRAGENSKRKQYTCVVWVSRPVRMADLAKLDAVHDLALEQNTPVRVLHRRSALERGKVIHSCKCRPLNDRFFVLSLEASAGTYIKEFVHGDMGRTQPNVGSLLGCEADIIQLDVEKVIME